MPLRRVGRQGQIFHRAKYPRLSLEARQAIEPGESIKIVGERLGLHLEFHAGDQWTITSHVRAIAIEPSSTGVPC